MVKSSSLGEAHADLLNETCDVSSNSQTEQSELQALINHLTSFSQTGTPDLQSKYLLNHQDFGHFVKHVENDAHLKIRYDYFADNQTLILRMPGDLHECIQALILRLLDDKVIKLSQDHRCFVPFESLGNKEVRFVGSNDRMTPDLAMYDSRDASLPVLVIEIGIAQTAESLKEKADKYIRLGNGSIRYVYTLQVSEGSGEISLTTWTPEGDEQNTIHSATTRQQIRTADRTVGSGPGLEISMKEIMPEEHSTSPAAQDTVVISVQEIYDIFEAAEHLEADEQRKIVEKAKTAMEGKFPEIRHLWFLNGVIPPRSDLDSDSERDSAYESAGD